METSINDQDGSHNTNNPIDKSHNLELTHRGHIRLSLSDSFLLQNQDNKNVKDSRGSVLHHEMPQSTIDEKMEPERDYAQNNSLSIPGGVTEGIREPGLWACPFYVHNGDDCYTGYKRISDLRQHLYRKHLRPPYCHTCGLAFKTKANLKAHIQEQDCQPRNTSPPGISKEQEERIHRTSNSGRKTSTQRWFEIWKILFPDSELPPLSRIEIKSSWFSMRVNDMIHKYQDSQMMLKFMERSSLPERSDSTQLKDMVSKILQDFSSFVDSEDPIQ